MVDLIIRMLDKKINRHDESVILNFPFKESNNYS